MSVTAHSGHEIAPQTGARDVMFAVGIVILLTILFLPIPASLIDYGLALSIALSVLILMVATLDRKAARLLRLSDRSAYRDDAAAVAEHRLHAADPDARL